MSQPTRTPNPATSTRPERSSRRVAHRKPLAWLPLALLALLLLLALLIALVVRHASRGDDSSSAGRINPSAASSAPASTPASTPASSGTGTGTTGTGAGAPVVVAGALVGGAGISPAPAASAGGSTGTTVTAPAPGTAGTVLFAEGSSDVDSDGRQVVTAAAQGLRASGATAVQVIGYTDVVAGAPVNGPLSQQRADAVAGILRPLLPGVDVSSSAKADADPVASNDTDAGRQQNRRVAIVGSS